MKFTVCFAAIIALALPCPAQSQERTYIEGTWKEIGRADDSHGFAFSRPKNLILTGDKIVVFDSTSHSLIAFSRDGKLLWESGEPGTGPNGLDSVSIIAPDGKGGTIVVDRFGRRMTRLSSTGVFEQRTDITALFGSLAVMPNGRTVVASLAAGTIDFIEEWPKHAKDRFTPVVTKGASGTTVRFLSGPILWPAQSGKVVLSFVNESDVRVFNEKLNPTKQFKLLNPTSSLEKGGVVVPDKDSRMRPGESLTQFSATRVIRSAHVHGDVLYIVDDRTIASRPSIDAYDVSTGKYINSRQLPEPIRFARIDGDVMVGLMTEPVPALIVWKWEAAK